jgi:hypothetical protein
MKILYNNITVRVRCQLHFKDFITATWFSSTCIYAACSQFKRTLILSSLNFVPDITYSSYCFQKLAFCYISKLIRLSFCSYSWLLGHKGPAKLRPTCIWTVRPRTLLQSTHGFTFRCCIHFKMSQWFCLQQVGGRQYRVRDPGVPSQVKSLIRKLYLHQFNSDRF